MTTASILVVEDEASIAEAVRARLIAEGFDATVVGDGPAAVERCEADPPDLVVLDLMLPGMDGLEVCKRIQRREPIPVLMLTARTDEADKIAGFAVGADDYLTKPFSMRELIYRVRAILRRAERSRGGTGDLVQRGPLAIDPARRRVTTDGSEVSLTPIEFDILHTLAREPGVVYNREKLMDTVWGYVDATGGRVVDSHVARLRKKLAEANPDDTPVRTVHGVGYAFRDV
ncbi:MAG TPA: response regulator transcription factor [Actinomycetota bacterium]|nr:response regulator transcription factor [Actinomycetota bacterium]